MADKYVHEVRAFMETTGHAKQGSGERDEYTPELMGAGKSTKEAVSGMSVDVLVPNLVVQGNEEHGQ